MKNMDCNINNKEVIYGTKKPYLGVELEVECNDLENANNIKSRVVDSLMNKNKWALCKEDPSLNKKTGFEIATAPMLIDEHKEKWEKSFFSEDFINGLKQFSHNAGMHVHLNRNSLSYIGLARLIYLIYGQKENKYFIQILAERKPNLYWNLSPKDIEEYMEMNNIRHDRNEALNLKNRNTVEFRMFASNISKKSIYKNIEFVAAAQQFCNNELFTLPTWENFMSWVFQHESEYPYLSSFLKEKKESGEFDFDKKLAFYELQLFKESKAGSYDVIYYQRSSNGDRVFCTKDGKNWWVVTNDDRIINLCGTAPDFKSIERTKIMPIESLAI